MGSEGEARGGCCVFYFTEYTLSSPVIDCKIETDIVKLLSCLNVGVCNDLGEKIIISC